MSFCLTLELEIILGHKGTGVLGLGSMGRPQRVRGEGAGSDKSNSARIITIYLVYSDQESFKKSP